MHDTPTPTPAAILARLDAGDDAGARAALRAAFAAGPPTAAPAAWARAAEAVGEPVLATAAWQSVLDADPSHRPALRALRALHEERGDTARAAACAARLRALDAPPPAPSPQAGPVVPAAAPEEAEPPPLGAPSHADLVRFAHRFAGRAGVHARMWHDPSRGHGWGPVQGAITPDLVEGHLRGNLTLGTYLVEQGDHTRHLVFDLDVRKAALEAAFGDPARAASLRALVHAEGLRLRAALRAAGLDPLLVDSGYKGRHLWCVFDRPEPAAAVRALGNALAATAPTAPPDARPLPELLDSLLALETRLAALTEERDAQRRRVTARVLALPSRTLTHEGHTFSVSDEGGIPALTITPPARTT